MPSGLLRVLSISVISATALAAGATSAFAADGRTAAPLTVACPTVAQGSGTLDPLPSPGVDWSGCDLTGADFGSADIHGADLSKANLSEANLTDANADQVDFAKAKLFDANAFGAALTNANFTGANLTFFEASNLTGSDLQDTNISGVNFGGATLTHVRSGGVTASASNQPILPAQWSLTSGFLIGPGADFSGDDLSGSTLTNLDFTGDDFAGTNLTNANLKNDNFAQTDVQGAIFAGVNWPGVESGDITGTPASMPVNWKLTGGYLIGPDANLTSANLANANLTGADLSGATLYLGSLADANLTNADFRGAFLDVVDLTGATWSNTICPDGTNSDSDADTCVNNIDDTPPSASPTIDGPGGRDSWFTGPVTVVWHWTDGNATIDPHKCPAKTTSKRQGPVTITGTCFNALGAEGEASVKVKIDSVPPMVAVTGVASGHVYPLSHVPSPGCGTTDAVSGVATPAKVTVTGPKGAGAYTATCAGATDNAGNQAAPVSVHYTLGYGFAGFTSPKAGSKLAKSARAIAVGFRLADAHGKPLSVVLASGLGRKHDVRVTLSGPGIAPATVACQWSSAHKDFGCSVKTPAKVKTGKRYLLTVTENVGSGLVTAPVIGKAANPESVSFR